MSSQRTALIGLVVGVVSIPLIALGATAVLSSDAPTEAPPVAAVSTTGMPGPTTTTVAPDPVAEVAPGPDIEAACGTDGETLAAAEVAGTISDVQQAALDALRPICEEAGMPLPAADPGEVVVVETVRGTPTRATAATTTSSSSGVSDDDDGEDEDHDEGGHEDHDDDHGDEDHGDDDDRGDD